MTCDKWNDKNPLPEMWGRKNPMPVWSRLVAAMLIWLSASLHTHAQLVISEIMASNQSILRDDFGNFSDWIELFNRDGATVPMMNWSLSDDPESPRKWVFPDVVLPPGGYLLIWASDADRRDPHLPLHLNFKLNASGEFLGLYDPEGRLVSALAPEFPPILPDQSFGIPMSADQQTPVSHTSRGHFLKPPDASVDGSWMNLDFQIDSSWRSSSASIGYDTTGTVLENTYITTIPAKSTSIYLRIPFQASNPENFSSLSLQVQFDDGFALYLNNQKVLAVNAPDQLDWNSRSTANISGKAALVTRTFDLTPHIGLMRQENLLAVHLLNISELNSDMLWTGKLLAESAGTFPDNSHYDFLITPSPNKPNSSAATPILAPPTFSHSGGILAEPLTLEISHSDPQAEIRYTTDGSKPTSRSRLYSQPLNIRSNQHLLASAFRSDFLPSQPGMAHFQFRHFSLLNWNSNLPVLVFQKNTDKRIDGFSPLPGTLTVLSPDLETTTWNTPDIVTSATLKERGSSTAGRPKQSFSLELVDLNGNDIDLAPLGLPADSDWVLWGPYNFDRSFMRNPFMYELSRRIGQYAPRTRFVELFVSDPSVILQADDYLGLYVLTEKIKRHDERVDLDRLNPEDITPPDISGGYLFKIDRLDPGDSGILAGNELIAMVEPKESDITRPQRLWITDYLNDFTDSLSFPASGEYRNFIDVQSFVDHHILNEFSKNPDGFRLSAYLHKPRNGPLRAGPVWDFDRTMGNDDDFRAFDPVGWSDTRNYGWYGSLLRNADFTQLWIDSFQKHQEEGGPMSVRAMTELIDSMAKELQAAAQRNFQRWPEVQPPLGTYNSEVSQLKSWVTRRHQWISSLYAEAPELAGPLLKPIHSPTPVSFVSNKDPIHFRLDGLDPRMPGGGIRPGTQSISSPNSTAIRLTQNTRITARARRGSTWSSQLNTMVVYGPPPQLEITELHYHPAPSDQFPEAHLEFIELENVSASPVNLDGIQFSGGIEFTAPAHLMMPGDLVVIALHPENLAKAFHIHRDNILGPWSGRLSNSGETLTISDPAGRPITAMTYSDSLPWPPAADGDGHSLTRSQPLSDPNIPSSWRASIGPPSPNSKPEILTQILMAKLDPTTESMIFQLNHLPEIHLQLWISESIAHPNWSVLQNISPNQISNSFQLSIPLSTLTRNSINSQFFLRLSPPQP